MRIALFNDNQIGIAYNSGIVDVGQLLEWNNLRPQESLIEFMGNFEDLKPTIEKALSTLPLIPLNKVALRAPVPNPSKIVAAPVNYRLHQDEMNEQFNNAEFTIEKLGFFLKAPSSIIGPNDTVLVPYRDRRFDHEAELAFVVKKTAQNVSYENAADYIFGYFALLDMTMRGKEDRPMRKSFDTFTPIGPWIVTSDEVGNPNELSFKLWVNDEVRQSANTKDLIYDCYKFFAVASHVMTLEPGDIVTTGTPEGVGPIKPGDLVKIHVDRIGEFSVSVDYRPGV